MYCCLEHLNVCKLKCSLFISAIALFFLPTFLGESWLGKFRLYEWLVGKAARGKRPYPAGGVGYPRLALLRLLATRVL
jgi:hypothetical protein